MNRPTSLPSCAINKDWRENLSKLLSALFARDPDYSSSPPPADSELPLFSLVEHSPDSSDQPRAPHKEDRLLIASALYLSRMAIEPTPFGSVLLSSPLSHRDLRQSKSEAIKRKAHSLRLLLHLLQRSGYYFRFTTSSLFLLRRCVVPNLLVAAVTELPAVQRVLLQLFTLLWEHYRPYLLMELGVMIDSMFFHQLLSSAPSHPQSLQLWFECKKDVLDCLFHLCRSPLSCASLFAHYDQHTDQRLTEKLFACLLRVIESPLAPLANTPSNEVSSSRDITVLSSLFTGAIPTPTPQHHRFEFELRRSALHLVLHITRCLAQWGGVPGLKPASPAPSKTLLDASPNYVPPSDTVS